MKTILLALAFLLTLSACTSLKVYSPNPAVEPPELRGERGIKLGGELVGAHETKATDHAERTPPPMDKPELNTAFDFFSSAVYAPIEELEAGLQFSPLHAGVSGIVRFQAVGEGMRTAEEGNVPLAFYLKGGRGQANGDNTYGVTFSHFSGKIEETYVHAGMSSGYRVSKNILLYGGLAAGQYWMKAEIQQNANTYKGYATGQGYTAGTGMYASWKYVQFFASGEYTHLRYSGTSPLDGIYLHTGVTFAFGH